MVTEPLYDVVVYELATRRIESIPGVRMRLNEGFYNAQKRQATVDERLNDRFSTEIVETGRYVIEDILP